MSKQINLYSNLRENSKTIDIRQTDLNEELKFDKLAVKKIEGLQKPQTVETKRMLEETSRSQKPVGTRSRVTYGFCKVYC